MTIDSHQHFWKFDPVRDAWIDSSMKEIQRDFMPWDLKPELEKTGFDGCIAVQADQSAMETQFLLNLANEFPWIQKVVGWVDLNSPEIEPKLESYKSEPKLAGFRMILQVLEPEAMADSKFLHGISLLQKYGFTYDILIYPKHLKAAFELAKKFPDQPFVVDHLAKPNIKEGEYEFWKQGISEFRNYPMCGARFQGWLQKLIGSIGNLKTSNFIWTIFPIPLGVKD
jgi:L-fuconolactonase